jgi:anaerobic ribonucleoside-triphosphate reductase activating protein
LWGFGKGNDVSAEDILKQCASLDGITLHGGEPLDQAKDLQEIVDVVKKHGKTVLLFTGYTYKELNETQRWIWLNSDIVVSGRYDEAKRNIYLQFRGSTNQKVYVHQGKYKDYKIKDGQTVAILSFSEDGEMRVRGFQNDELNKLLKDIKSKDE